GEATSVDSRPHSVLCTLGQGVARELIKRSQYVLCQFACRRIICDRLIHRHKLDAQAPQYGECDSLIHQVSCEAGQVSNDQVGNVFAVFPAICQHPLELWSVCRPSTLTRINEDLQHREIMELAIVSKFLFLDGQTIVAQRLFRRGNANVANGSRHESPLPESI